MLNSAKGYNGGAMQQVMDSMDEVREKAASWLVELDATDSVQDSDQQQAFEAWLAEDNRHRHVYSQMQQMWISVNPQRKGKKVRRRIAAASLCIAGMLTCMQLPWAYWGADYKTAVGGISEINLPDGSTATLNTNSAINVRYEDGSRVIELVRGEVLVDVRKDSGGHRFIVEAGDARAEALGTRYSVQIHEAGTQVSVFESRVLVRANGHAEQQVVTQGKQVKVSRGKISQPFVLHDQHPDWAWQQLIFNDAPLSEVIARLQRYHPGVLVLSDELDQSERRFTGLLPADDFETAINLLAVSMGLKLQQLSPYFVWIK